MNFILLASSAFVGTIITCFSIYFLKSVAIRSGLVDVPGGRKKHVDSVPLIGGIGIFLGFLFSSAFFDQDVAYTHALIISGGILVFFGVIDDYKELKPLFRLVIQSLACLFLVKYAHFPLENLKNPFGLSYAFLKALGYFLTIFFSVGMINAVNMIDGHDGLAGSVVLGQLFFMATIFYVLGQKINFYLITVFIGLLLSFLSFNFPHLYRKKASIFLGDAGSTFIGFLVAWFSVSIAQSILFSNTTYFRFFIIFWILAYPLFDLYFVSLNRILQGRSPFKGGRDHLHHILLDHGIPHSLVTYILLFISLCFGLIGILFSIFEVKTAWQLSIFIVAFLLYFFLARKKNSSSIKK